MRRGGVPGRGAAAGVRGGGLYGLDVDRQLLPVWQAQFPPPTRPHLALADGLLGTMPAAFEVVVGNPPFGGSPDPAALPDLMMAYHWWRLSRRGGGSFPRELWFLERSLRLLRPGGLLGLVLPEGFLANKRWRPQREELLRTAQVEAVIGLPRSVFRGSRAAVKTCLIFVRQQAPAAGHVVRLAELDDEDLLCPAALIAAWDAGAVQATEAPWREA